ncbi:MAG: hypothetical protein U0586_15675 [Candidatus Brocadiaceae bacterium]
MSQSPTLLSPLETTRLVLLSLRATAKQSLPQYNKFLEIASEKTLAMT